MRLKRLTKKIQHNVFISENKKLLNEFIDGIKTNKYPIRERSQRLKALPIEVVREIGKKIIFSDCDGFNTVSKEAELSYFDNLDRWQKEYFIEQRFYKLLN